MVKKRSEYSEAALAALEARPRAGGARVFIDRAVYARAARAFDASLREAAAARRGRRTATRLHRRSSLTWPGACCSTFCTGPEWRETEWHRPTLSAVHGEP